VPWRRAASHFRRPPLLAFSRLTWVLFSQCSAVAFSAASCFSAVGALPRPEPRRLAAPAFAARSLVPHRLRGGHLQVDDFSCRKHNVGSPSFLPLRASEILACCTGNDLRRGGWLFPSEGPRFCACIVPPRNCSGTAAGCGSCLGVALLNRTMRAVPGNLRQL
jgi:hypothetical protein